MPDPRPSLSPSLAYRLPNASAVFVGRGREVEWLEAAVRRGPVTIVAGPLGLGKTGLVLHTLHRRFADRVAGALFVYVRPGEPVVEVRQEILRALASGAGDAKGPKREKIDFRQMSTNADAAIAAAIDMAEAGGRFVVLDDIDNADGAAEMSELLGQLTAYARASRWIATSQMAPTLPALAGQSLVLEPMEVEELAQLAELCRPGPDPARLGRAAAVAAGGSPWLLLQELAGQSPGARAWLDGLEPESIAFLTALAVLRAPLAVDLLDRFAPLPPAEALAALERRGLVVREASGLRIHELVRGQIAGGAAPAEELERWRQQAASVLVEEEHPQAVLEALRLLLELGRAEDGAALLARRGDALMASGYAPRLWSLLRDRAAPALARWSLRCAAELGNPTALSQVRAPAERNAGERLAWGWTLRARGEMSAAVATAREVAEASRQAGLPEVEAEALLLAGIGLRHEGHLDAALEALASIRTDDAELARRRDAAQLSCRIELGAIDDAAAQSALERLAAGSGLEREAAFDIAAGLHLLGQPERAFEVLRRVQTSARAGYAALLSTRMAILLEATMRVEAGELAEAARLTESVRPFSRGASLLAPFLRAVDGARRLARGELGDIDGLVARAGVGRDRACGLRIAALEVELAALRAQDLAPPSEAADAEATVATSRTPADLELAARRQLHAARAGRSVAQPSPDARAPGPTSPGGRATELTASVLVALARAGEAVCRGGDHLRRAADEAQEAMRLAARRGQRVLAVEARCVLADSLLALDRRGELGDVARELAAEGKAMGSPRFESEAAFYAAAGQGRLDPELLEALAARADVAPVAARRAQALLGAPPPLDEVDRRVLDRARGSGWADAVELVASDGPPPGARGWRPGWGIDDRRQSVWLPDGRAIELRSRALLWRILEVLADRGGAASKEELVLEAWKEKEYLPLRHDTRLHVAVRKLRGVIEDHPDDPGRLLTTEEGYRLGGVVRRARQR